MTTVLRVRMNKDLLISHLRRDHAQTGNTDAERRRWSVSELNALHEWAHHPANGHKADHLHVK